MEIKRNQDPLLFIVDRVEEIKRYQAEDMEKNRKAIINFCISLLFSLIGVVAGLYFAHGVKEFGFGLSDYFIYAGFSAVGPFVLSVVSVILGIALWGNAVKYLSDNTGFHCEKQVLTAIFIELVPVVLIIVGVLVAIAIWS